MPATPTLPLVPDGEPQAGGEERGRERLEGVIRQSVIGTLGRPDRLFRVAVMPLWRDRYRVNVLTGADAGSVRIAHSYFVVADDLGRIVTSTPKISREYE